jgi:hypothetical protein
MKCVCGYEDDKERFIEIGVGCEESPRDIHFFKVYFPNKTFGRRRLYACPKCGTLKFIVEEE